jgi:hypothetical protein
LLRNSKWEPHRRSTGLLVPSGILEGGSEGLAQSAPLMRKRNKPYGATTGQEPHRAAGLHVSSTTLSEAKAMVEEPPDWAVSDMYEEMAAPGEAEAEKALSIIAAADAAAAEAVEAAAKVEAEITNNMLEELSHAQLVRLIQSSMAAGSPITAKDIADAAGANAALAADGIYTESNTCSRGLEES